MVDIEFVQRSLPSRPRKAVVFWAFIALCVGGAGLAFWMVLKNVPTFMAQWSETTWTMMGTQYNLRSFLIDYGLPLGQFVGFFIAWILCNKITGWRLFYLFFSLPSTIVAFLLILLGAALILVETPSVTEAILKALPQDKLDMILKYAKPGFYYGCLGWAGFMAFFCFIALFYNVTYPIKYGRLYSLKRSRIRLSKSFGERHRVRKQFYTLYKKKQCKELIGLLVEPYLEPDSELELIPEAVYYMKLAAGDNNGEIKGYEIDAALEEEDEDGARKLYNKSIADVELARSGDLTFLNTAPQVIVTAGAPVQTKKVIVKKVRAKRKAPKRDTRPINDPLWGPDEI